MAKFIGRREREEWTSFRLKLRWFIVMEEIQLETSLISQVSFEC